MTNSDGLMNAHSDTMDGSVKCAEYGLLTLSPNPFGKTVKKSWPLTTSAMTFY